MDHSVFHSFPTRRSSDLGAVRRLAREHLVLQEGLERRMELGGAGRGSRERRVDLGHAQTSVTRRPEWATRSEEHTSELQSPCNLICRLLLEKNNILNFNN